MTKISSAAFLLKSFLEFSKNCLTLPTKASKGKLVFSSQHTQAVEQYSNVYWGVMIKDGHTTAVAELLADKLYSPKTSAKERELLDNLLGYMTCTVDKDMALYQAVCKVAGVVSSFDVFYPYGEEEVWEYCLLPNI